MQSQIGKFAYEIELWIQIDKENFMLDTNQCEFKMDGQDEGREDREASFKRLRKQRLEGARKPIRVKDRRSQSHGELYIKECHYLNGESDLRIKYGFHSYMIEDSKLLAQSGYAQRS